MHNEFNLAVWLIQGILFLVAIGIEIKVIKYLIDYAAKTFAEEFRKNKND